ncbi:MAG: SLC13 family permease [bacterium]|nr:SLC13 family permease [bacterium]
MNKLVSPRFGPNLALAMGPFLAIITLLIFPDDPERPLAARTAAAGVWMAVWWLTEAVPLAVTSLLPLAFFPLMGVMKANSAAALYMNDIVFLFVGGFCVALAMEKWELHRRVALRVVLLIGGGPRRTLLGFMAATALLSMWISNTATAMMMVPIAAAVLSQYERTLKAEDFRRTAVGLLIGVAYGASIGGIATLVGTPPNLAFAQIYHMQFPQAPPVTFAQWMFFALPFSVAFLFAAWGMLCWMWIPRASISSPRQLFREELSALGPMKREERLVLIVFAVMAILWITRQPLEFGAVTIPGWSNLLPEPSFVGDGTVAIALAAVLFLLPAKEKAAKILDWETAKKLPWGIVLLFGGGFALAGAISQSGLADWIGLRMQELAALPPMGMTASICTVMTFLTELTSNTATTQMALPILGATAIAIGSNPLYLMVPATISASCAFMLPVATPPNAIIFGTGKVRVMQMAKTGFLLNWIGVVLVTLWMHLIGPLTFAGSP